MTADEVRDDTSTQVKLTVELLTMNGQLSSDQRQMLYDLTARFAREARALVLVSVGEGKCRVRMERESSKGGKRFVDIYNEEVTEEVSE
jgi:hypothetical protein